MRPWGGGRAAPASTRLGASLASGLLAFLPFQGGCGPAEQGLPARGSFAGKPVETTVDSEWARVLLSRGAAAASRLDVGIDRARRLLRDTSAAPEALAGIARRYSPDVATCSYRGGST